MFVIPWLYYCISFHIYLHWKGYGSLSRINLGNFPWNYYFMKYLMKSSPFWLSRTVCLLCLASHYTLGTHHPCYILSLWSESRSVVSDSLWPHGLYSPWNSLGQNTGVGSCSLLQGIPIQGSILGLSHCRRLLYCLSQPGKPYMLSLYSADFLSDSYTIYSYSRFSHT